MADNEFEDVELEYFLFDDASDRLGDAAAAVATGNLEEAINKLGEALTIVMAEATEKIEELQAQISELESQLATR